ncbi:MAG: hypothetical protein K2P81_16705 [Bacteriovoracaceae bacterium]|nr:hypothetical protein [Bacteriovoracaceae bacterium]
MKRNLETLNIIRKNVKQSPWIDLYHSWLVLSWFKTVLLFLAFFASGNLLFGLGYWILGNGAIHNSTGSYMECVFFSVQTMATIGYGHMAPATTAAHILVAIEAATGVIIMALLSGLFFGKFSQAKSRLRFTKKMLIANYNGKPTLKFRMANERANQIIDARLRLTLLRPEVSDEGMRIRRFIDLPLELSHAPLFAMSLTAMHILENGPLKGMSVQEMCEKGFEFFVTIVGTDGTFGQTIHATTFYSAKDIQMNGQWADIVEVLEDGTRVVDFMDFEKINPL